MKTRTTLAALAMPAMLAAQTITTFTTEDGLPSDNIRDLAIDAVGNIWLATQQGVAMFDGNTVTIHNTTSHPGLPTNDLQAVAVMADGTVWVGSDLGVSVLDGADYVTYTTADGLGDNEVNSIAEAPGGEVWIGTINGATRFSQGVFTAFGMPDIPFGGVWNFAFHDNGEVWMAGGLFGVIVFDGDEFRIINTGGGLISNRIRAIAFDDEGNKWIATADGISVLDGADQHVADHAQVFILPPPDELNPITDIAVDASGRVWAGVYVDYLVTVGGVSVYDGADWTQFEAADGLAGPNVSRLGIDGNGDVWVATSTGLSRISDINIGVQERSNAAPFQLMPVPANDRITLLCADGAALRMPYEVLDASGRMMARATLQGESTVIDVSALPPGVYVLRTELGMQRFVLSR